MYSFEQSLPLNMCQSNKKNSTIATRLVFTIQANFDIDALAKFFASTSLNN